MAELKQQPSRPSANYLQFWCNDHEFVIVPVGGPSFDVIQQNFTIITVSLSLLMFQCDETLHHVHRITISRELRVTGCFTPSSRYNTIGEFNVDSKAECSALSSTRSQKKKLKQTMPVPL